MDGPGSASTENAPIRRGPQHDEFTVAAILSAAPNCFCIIAAINGRNPVATYLELKEQAEKLLAEAERMREQEIGDAIADIKEKIRLYGLTAEDLGLARSSGPGRAPRAKTAPTAAKYRGPNGETWGGGRGRKPQWVTQALKEGKSLEDFAVRSGR
jgi:DNA-binding protein H-NS